MRGFLVGLGSLVADCEGSMFGVLTPETLGGLVFDGVGGEAKGVGPVVLDGPGPLMGAGAKAFAGASVRGGSNTKPESIFVSQVAQAGSSDSSP